MSLTRHGIAYRVASELPDGSYVNLGIGIPTLVAEFIPQDKDVFLHSENGILGFGSAAVPGEEDPDLVNATKEFVTLRPGASLFDHALSFSMIRGGHLTHAIMGAIQVAANGDLANWHVPGKKAPGVGGAMDLAFGTKKIYIAMSHLTNKGKPKIVSECAFPLTAPRCVSRIFTDLAVIDITENGLELIEVAPGLTPADIQEQTDAPLMVKNWKQMNIPEMVNGKELVLCKVTK